MLLCRRCGECWVWLRGLGGQPVRESGTEGHKDHMSKRKTKNTKHIAALQALHPIKLIFFLVITAYNYRAFLTNNLSPHFSTFDSLSIVCAHYTLYTLHFTSQLRPPPRAKNAWWELGEGLCQNIIKCTNKDEKECKKNAPATIH
jgi:hypothetical protein